MTLRLGPYTLTLSLRRDPRPAPAPPADAVPHAEGSRRLGDIVATLPVDDEVLAAAKPVSPWSDLRDRPRALGYNFIVEQ